MVTVKEVKTRREQKEFLEFPLKLYKGCPYYSPALYLDEKRIFKKDYFYYETSEAVYFNAYRDGKMVGRIGGILQRSANEKWNQKRVRFTRFDLIDDLEVCQALLKAVEDWAKEKGMDTVFGPMGFSDMEPEGLLISGFDEPTTFSENYNYPYYQTLLEKCGYGKDVDWLAHQIRLKNKGENERIQRLSTSLMKRYNLHYAKTKNTNELLKKYGRQFFDLVEESYRDLYQTVPFTDSQIDDMISSFRLILRSEYITLVCDENDRVVTFMLMFPFIAPILNKTGGKLRPWILPKLLHTMAHPKVMELGLIGVRDDYKNTGIAWIPTLSLFDALESGKIDYCETNLTLETNLEILNMFAHMDCRDHRRVRTFIKNID